MCGMCLGCGLVLLICSVLSGGFVSGCCPLPMFLGEVLSDFRFFWWPLASCIVPSWFFFGLYPFGNKFLLIQKKRNLKILLNLNCP